MKLHKQMTLITIPIKLAHAVETFESAARDRGGCDFALGYALICILIA